MEYMQDLKEKLCEELKDIARKGDLSAGDLETVHKLTDTIKNIFKIEMLEGDEDGQKYGNNGYNRRYDMIDPRLDDDSAYARRKRDSRGRYMGYTHDEQDEVIEMLNKALNMAPNKRMKESIHRCMEQLKDN